MKPSLAVVGLLTLCVSPAVDAADLPLTARGASYARGVLVNVTGGTPHNAPIDPRRPTVVVAHGLNPFHPWLRFIPAEQYAAAVARQSGAGVNVLAWDWNAATFPGIRLSTLDRNAIDQGRLLAEALLRAGVDPGRLHLVGSSHGGLVVASAAYTLYGRSGRISQRLTLLDPIPSHHRILFEQLRAASVARQVDHVWAAGPSGFGREAAYPGVANRRLEPQTGVLGLVRPLRVDHLNTVRWFIARAGSA